MKLFGVYLKYIHKKSLDSDWLTGVHFIEIQCQKMKYVANAEKYFDLSFDF
jgi:hypothetical protein